MDDESKSLFSARKKDWWNNACLNYMRGGNTWTGYSMGYKNGADILCNHVDLTQRSQDTLIFPIIFLYRHYLELIIKEILSDCAKILEEDIKFKHHNLSSYWEMVKSNCSRAVEDEIPSDMKDQIENVIRQLICVDKGSDAFRYPFRTDGTPTLQGITHINIKQFSEQVSKASDALEAISSMLSVIVEMKSEHQANMRQLYGSTQEY